MIIDHRAGVLTHDGGLSGVVDVVLARLFAKPMRLRIFGLACAKCALM
jgi:hypothetical protein